MSFDRLHPAVQHHVVNSLGWASLRELQEASIAPVLDGEDLLVVGPTAGGKTEAAALPLLSRMLTEDWGGLSVVYVSPLRALANDLEVRLGSLCALVGRSAAAWHGDVGPSKRKAILREPPDLLITTPESLEVMLVSTKVDHRRLFRDARAVVVDEIHSFASDDRGWHLFSVLSRIEDLHDRRLQRLGLSATVGNPEEVLERLQMRQSGPGRVVQPELMGRRKPELVADHVGSLRNASKVIAGLHKGEKRLVFCDSRSDVERLASALREQDVDTYVSHSSLSKDERLRAETAFAEGRDCVIVATSTLELGIDVGDLDRVIQIDAPTSVASFLQRMGRTGRREGATSNTLFLTTKPEYLLRALGLGLLWERGFVEDVHGPPSPLHIVAQQALAMCLQQGQIGLHTWFDEIANAGLAEAGTAEAIVAHMLQKQMLEVDGGMLLVGQVAEETFGRRHFMELLSVFTTPPLIEVRHGREHLGSVHESSFITRENKQPVLLLAGRSWALEEVDWRRRLAYVVPAPDPGDSRWLGSGQALSFALCRAMRDVVAGDEGPIDLSERARAELAGLIQSMEWISKEATSLVTERGRTRWWTFGGTLANLELQWRLGELTDVSGAADELSIPVQPFTTLDDIKGALATPPVGELPVAHEALVQLKFNECLPEQMAETVLRERARDRAGVAACISGGMRSWSS